MNRKNNLLLIILLLATSCGTQKKNLVQSQGKPTIKMAGAVVVPSTPIQNTKTELRQIDKVNIEALYPMPDNPKTFVRFEIQDTKEYVEVFKEIAQYEMKAFGIPASITLAQGILESASGMGALTKKTNNHFGIKCHENWEGDVDFHDDDAVGECFRKYNHPMFSYRDHSIFLASRARYQFLFNYERNDYRRWAHGLKRAGYATDHKYPQKLIDLIERYQLDKYDHEVISEGFEPVRELKNYEVFTHVVQKGDTLYGLSMKYTISIEEIKKLNQLPTDQLAIGQTLNLRRVTGK